MLSWMQTQFQEQQSLLNGVLIPQLTQMPRTTERSSSREPSASELYTARPRFDENDLCRHSRQLVTLRVVSAFGRGDQQSKNKRSHRADDPCSQIHNPL